MLTLSRSVLGACILSLVVSCAGGSDSTPQDPQDPGNPANPANPANPLVPGELPATTCLAGPSPNQGVGNAVYLQRVFPGISGFSQALGLVLEPGGNWWYVLEKTGMIYRFANNASVSGFQEVVDLTAIVDPRSEGGLLGMAFDPDFANNGHIYLSYTASNAVANFHSVISRVSFNAARSALDLDTQKTILTLPQPAGNHNGGHIAFGLDGFLYIGFGDGGSDQFQSQNTDSLLGSMLRIDVTDVPETAATIEYTVPQSNPFNGTLNSNYCRTGSGTGNCVEIFAWGFRNPWRWSFDRATGELWLADVGSQSWEEVDKVEINRNYGWPCYEGDHFASCPFTIDNLSAPVYEYAHPATTPSQASITGGYVYRGSQVPGLIGQYVFGDFHHGTVWALNNINTTPERQDISIGELGGFSLATFAEDLDGELYLIKYGNGEVYKLAVDNFQVTTTFPSLLSETGCADATDPALPAVGMIPYNINSRLWSDNAEKFRWLSIPQDSRIQVRSDGIWEFPAGSILRKDFYLNDTIIETRLLAHHTDGAWAGYSYEWNAGLTDADLRLAGASRDVNGQTWDYPSTSQCMQCHRAEAGRVLGPETAQMNRDFNFPGAGVHNQLDYLDNLGAFDVLPTAPASMPDPTDDSNSDIADKARAYLHANCASCHRPPGVGRTEIDLRYATPLADMGICNVQPHPELVLLEAPNALLLTPGNPAASIISLRMNRRDAEQMPILGSNIIDARGVTLINDWISGLSACP